MPRNWEESFLGPDGEDGIELQLQKGANFFKCVVRDFEHLLKTDSKLIFRQEMFLYFNQSALRRVISC